MKFKLIKNCPNCKRDFEWRKKWAKNWENVIYCSERCRRRRSSINHQSKFSQKKII